jgi:hypothetical protein
MTEVQRELALAALLLAFFCVYSFCAEIVRTDGSDRSRAAAAVAGGSQTVLSN